MSSAGDRPENIEDWTKEHVHHWLLHDLKVPQEYADRLYKEDVSGASLICFQKNDLLELDVKQGPAVQIISNVKRLRQSSESLHKEKAKASSKDDHTRARNTDSEEKTSETNSITSTTAVSYADPCGSMAPSAEVKNSSVVPKGETSLNFSIQKDCGRGGAEQPSENLQSLQCQGIQNEAVEKVLSPVMQCKSIQDKPKGSPETQRATNGNVTESQPITANPSKQTASKSEMQRCVPRPFDKSCESHTYRKNSILPPETGPSNLLDPVHEYKLLGNTENATESEILRKFTDEVLRFAAACMNSRTNGTIHFGVGDAPCYVHGQIVGIKVLPRQKYIDKLNQCLEDCFSKNSNIARACIRPPKFVEVLQLQDPDSDMCVIEVDIVPSFSKTQENLFYTSHISHDKEGKKFKEQCLFIRKGASSLNVLKNPGDQQDVTENVKSWALARMSIEEKDQQEPRQSNQGQRLKQLISQGRDSLADSLHKIVVTNKCPSSELEHLHFLKEIKPFAVLEFDPESELNGSCNFFRKDRTANLHYPRMYNTGDSVYTIIAKLNLFKQPSWVFCNGRTDEESEDDKPLGSTDWLKKRAAEVQDLVTFICNPDILPTEKLQVIFLLHSSVERISSPLLDTFCMIYQKLGGVENMICICRDASVFSKWRNLVETRCEIDISSNCIYELNLNEVNSTIMKMKGPQTLSANRYLPSFGSSSVLLTKKDEDQMTVLDILCENECENTEIECSNSFEEFKNKTEEDFYRGGKVTWWNFYLSEKPGCLPFIKRDKFEELYDLITPQGGYKTACVIINLFHPPGCGGTTLAMHILWSLRRKFRCAVLTNNKAQNLKIAAQVTELLTYGNTQQTSYVPVLLLVDDMEDVEGLHRCVLLAAHEKRHQDSQMVIILNCKRSQFPDQSSRNSRIENVYIMNKLSPKEQRFFEQKLRDLKDNHKKPETFYAFMIMTKNFSEKYIEDIVNKNLVGLEISSKAGQLLSFLALLNTFVNDSSMSLSVCEEFVELQHALWGKETLEEKMNPYFALMICSFEKEHGTYQAVRFLHKMIAEKCLEVLKNTHNLKLSEITANLLHCDLLFKLNMGKDILVQNVLSMLVTRQQIELGDDKNTQFSPLIEKIQAEEGTSQIKEVLIQSTKRFEKNATIPQALARHFYLKENDFASALKWAHDAQQKLHNSYMADTLGRVYKSHLKYEIEHAEKHSEILTLADLETYLNLASKATNAFRDSQDLADKDQSFDNTEQHNKKRQCTYNTSGYAGEMDVAMLIFNVLQKIPFFNRSDKIGQQKMLNFLNGTLPVSDLHEDEANVDFVAMLKKNEKFLVNLKPRVKKGFKFFDEFYTYLKPRSIERATEEDRNKIKVLKHFKEYVKLFCTSEEERESERTSQPKLSLQQQTEDARQYLEAKRADTFAGLLQCLNDKNGTEMEKIFKKHKFIFENSAQKTLMIRTNFIFANIVLHCIKPSSKVVKKYEELIALLNDVLQEEGTQSKSTELYFLSMLLLWPRRDNTLEDIKTSKNISIYVSSIKKSFHRRYSHLFYAKSTMAHFYLGKSRGLKRIVHKGKLDQCINREGNTSTHQLWQSGAIWREPITEELLLRVNGITENADIYVHYPGNLKIPVRPAYLGGVRSGSSMEKVSFYLGFSMEGPVAYDIKYTNDM